MLIHAYPKPRNHSSQHWVRKEKVTNFILNIIRLLRLHTKKICVTQKDDWNSRYSNSASVDQELVLSSLFCLANPGPNSEIIFDGEEEASSSFEARMSRLRQHHKLPEFKLLLLGQDVGKEV